MWTINQKMSKTWPSRRKNTSAQRTAARSPAVRNLRRSLFSPDRIAAFATAAEYPWRSTTSPSEGSHASGSCLVINTVSYTYTACQVNVENPPIATIQRHGDNKRARSHHDTAV